MFAWEIARRLPFWEIEERTDYTGGRYNKGDKFAFGMEDFMEKKKMIVVLAVLILASLACSLFGGGSAGTEGNAPATGGESQQGDALSPGNSEKYDTDFPLPPKVENFTDMGNDMVNFQTPMSLTDVVAFYRAEFEHAGYEEREILTTIDDMGFSLVWDGHPSGEAIVLQGVDMGNGTVNVNIRLEDS